MEYIYISNIYGIYNNIKRNIMQLYKGIRKHNACTYVIEYTCAKMCIYIQIFMCK